MSECLRACRVWMRMHECGNHYTSVLWVRCSQYFSVQCTHTHARIPNIRLIVHTNHINTSQSEVNDRSTHMATVVTPGVRTHTLAVSQAVASSWYLWLCNGSVDGDLALNRSIEHSPVQSLAHPPTLALAHPLTFSPTHPLSSTHC